MTVEACVDQLEPQNQDAVIWRFMNMKKFENLITTAELYFCRADLFADQSEGLPPEGYYPFPHLNPLDVLDRRQIDDSLGNLAQFREAFYINCWHLFREETCKMWEKYGADGVAICSQYSLLKSALDAVTDRAFLGLVRYGPQGMKGWNLFRFVFTKRAEFADENEVRALLWIIDPLTGNDRHIDDDNRMYPRPLTLPPDRVLDGHRRKVDLRALVTQIVVSPWASSTIFEEITQLVRSNGYEIPVGASGLTRYRQFLPSL
jgi:hypothetical protein